MRSKLAHAAFWSITGSGSQYVVTFGLLVYLAHNLQPRDFGLMATVAIGLDLGTRIARWGQIELLQQPRYRNDAALNQSLRLSLAIACFFGLAFVAAAGPLGAVYRAPQLRAMMLLCAPTFLFSATSSTAEAILRSELRYGVLAIRGTVTNIVGAIAAILLVSLGYGAIALAAQRLIQAVVAGLWVWTALDWRPRLGGGQAWSPAMVREGAQIMAGTLMPSLVPRSIDLFAGFALGASQLGLMRVAFRINDFVGQLVVMPLAGVASSQLSALNGDLVAMRRAYLRLTQASAALMCPLLIGLTLVAPEAVPIIFGAKWIGCVPLVQIIGLLGIVAPINYYFAAAMVPLGLSRLIFRQGLFQVVLGVALAGAAAQISLIAIAVAHVARGTIVSLYNVLDLRRHMGIRLSEFALYLAPPYVATLAMAAVVTALRAALGDGFGPLPDLLLFASSGAATYAAILWGGGRIGLWPAHVAIIPRRRRAQGAPG